MTMKRGQDPFSEKGAGLRAPDPFSGKRVLTPFPKA
jgi:hypothetical protein